MQSPKISTSFYDKAIDNINKAIKLEKDTLRLIELKKKLSDVMAEKNKFENWIK